jgi:hypothetical protein
MRIWVVESLLFTLLLAGAGPGIADDKAPAKTSYDHLKVLEKAIGRWEGTFTAGDDKSAVTLNVEWMLDKKFLKEELQLKVGDKDVAVVIIYGWDAQTGLTLHGFTSNGDSGSGTAKFGGAEGKVSCTSSLVWVSGRKVGMERVIEFPEADRVVITDKPTQDGKAMPESKLELRRKK